MAQAAYWFKHDTNAKDDYKCMLLIDQLGLEGYGIFWILIETLREQDGYRYPIAMLPILAKRYGTSGEKMKAVVTGYKLFEVFEDDTFSSPALIRRMDDYDVLVESRRKGGSLGGKRRAENAAQAKLLSCKVSLTTPDTGLKESLSTAQGELGQRDSSAQTDLEESLSIAQGDLGQNDSSVQADLKESLSTTQADLEQTLSKAEGELKQVQANRRELNREELRRDDETGREGSVRGGLEGRSDLEEYRKVRIHSVSVAVVRSFLKDGYSLPEIDDVLDGLELYSGIDQVRSIGGLISSWLKKRRSSPRKTPGSNEYDSRYRLFTPKEVDRAGIWKEVSIVRIEGMSACRSAKGKVLMAFDTDIEKFGLCRREPKQHGQDWPD